MGYLFSINIAMAPVGANLGDKPKPGFWLSVILGDCSSSPSPCCKCDIGSVAGTVCSDAECMCAALANTEDVCSDSYVIPTHWMVLPL